MIDWSILRSNGPVDIAGNFARGYDMADKIVTRIHERNALGALAQNPDDKNALAHLYQANPATAVRLEELNMKRHEVSRKTDARNALGHIVGAIGEQQFGDFRQPNAITGTMPEPSIDASATGPGDTAVVADAARETPGSAVTAPSAVGDAAPQQDASPGEEPITVTAKRPEPPAEVHPDLSEDWRAYAEADPEGAMKTMIDRHKLNKQQAVDLAAQMDIIGRIAGSATDPESYARALQYGQALGYNISRLPKEYSPEAVAQIQQQSMTAKDAIKLKWDIHDDEIDNARQERAMQLQHQDRERGQDLSHEDRVRGQDKRGGSKGSPTPKPQTPTTVIGRIMDKQARGDPLSPAERQTMDEYRAKKGGGKSGGSIPRVKSVAEARALAPGTVFIDPQGNVRRR
jgi:hypothetical protein